MSGNKLYALLGRHLSHSYSSLIHKELGCKEYCHTELEREELKTFLKKEKIGGLNVTIPYKKDVIPFLSSLSREAEDIGSVNTITCEDGKLIGHNTDAYGFEFMVKFAGIDVKNKKVIILGSGGAHLAVKYALKGLGAREIVTISRSGEDNYENIHRHYDADVLVNATPVGMYPEDEGKILDLSPFKSCSGVLDLIYNPFRTNLLLQAEEMKIPYANGLSMLVAQAKRAEELFFLKSIPDEEILRIMKIISRDTRNIVLVGMPGSGKSTVGKALGLLSGKEVVDTDEEIVKTVGLSIPEIFEKGGEKLFREYEIQAVKNACIGSGKIVITGGGAVKREENYAPIKRRARVYHLERDLSILDREGRPLSKGADLEKMYEERLPLYSRFRDTVIEVTPDATKTAELIWRDFCENSCY